MTYRLLLLMALVTASVTVSAADLHDFRCSYATFSDQTGLHKVQDDFVLVFVTDPNGNATLIGNQGSSKIAAIPNLGGGGVTFVEVTPVGNVTVTAIDSAGRSTHSRQTIIAGKVIPTQYYGHCEMQ